MSENKRTKLKIAYEAIMIILVIISLISAMSGYEGKLAELHNLIWFIFLIDVSVRFIRSARKLNYLKNNPFDVVSIIPLEDMFLLARFSRFIKLFRYKNFIKGYLDRIQEIINKLNFTKVTIITFISHIVLATILTLLSSFTFVESIIWVELNFFKFNYVSENKDFIALSVIIKIFGIIYIGVALNKLFNFVKIKYDDWKTELIVK